MTGTIEKPHNAVATVQKVSSTAADLVLQSGSDVAGLIVNVDGVPQIIGNTAAPLGDTPLQIGTQSVISLSNERPHVVVSAVFLDEKQAVILDKYL